MTQTTTKDSINCGKPIIKSKGTHKKERAPFDPDTMVVHLGPNTQGNYTAPNKPVAELTGPGTWLINTKPGLITPLVDEKQGSKPGDQPKVLWCDTTETAGSDVPHFSSGTPGFYVERGQPALTHESYAKPEPIATHIVEERYIPVPVSSSSSTTEIIERVVPSQATPAPPMTGTDHDNQTPPPPAPSPEPSHCDTPPPPCEPPPPVAHNDCYEVTACKPSVLDVTANDTEPSGQHIKIIDATACNGSVSINEHNMLVYTPNEVGTNHDLIVYTIENEAGKTSTASVSLTIENSAQCDVECAPHPQAYDDCYTVPLCQTSTLDVTANDIDPLGQSLKIIGASASSGTVTINNDNTLAYTPNEAGGNSDYIYYTIQNEAGSTSRATVNLNIDSASGSHSDCPPHPQAYDDCYTVPLCKTSTLDVTANDIDPSGHPLQIIGASASSGTVTINHDNTLAYTPNEAGGNSDYIYYTIQNEAGNTSRAMVNLNIDSSLGANGDCLPHPQANDDCYTVQSCQASTLDVLSNDTDPSGQSLQIIGASASSGIVTINHDNTLAYTPNEAGGNSDYIYYTIQNEAGNTSRATVNLNIESASSSSDAAKTTYSESSGGFTLMHNQEYSSSYEPHSVSEQNSSTNSYVTSPLTAHDDDINNFLSHLTQDTSSSTSYSSHSAGTNNVQSTAAMSSDLHTAAATDLHSFLSTLLSATQEQHAPLHG